MKKGPTLSFTHSKALRKFLTELSPGNICISKTTTGPFLGELNELEKKKAFDQVLTAVDELQSMSQMRGGWCEVASLEHVAWTGSPGIGAQVM